ncbi:deoxyribonuclease-1-like isoform X2 [Acanthopagrus latus]|uniref:deoxyribonuclease-1-like isoform X2 n=1 Tax=Acanthopagrus latus TaxID=8177 RepID=UPI00187BF391|nr:deoxyribonuclease-1-like isoform X2 [Acanthopagrus latus]
MQQCRRGRGQPDYQVVVQVTSLTAGNEPPPCSSSRKFSRVSAAETHGRPSAHLNSPTMGRRSPLLPLLLLLLFSFLTSSVGGAKKSGFRICAFNVQKFDTVKSSNYRLMHTLLRIVSRCDITLLQDVVDPHGKAIKKLVDSLNRETDRYHYKSLSSKSLGNSPSNMQQYVFIYRAETVNVTGQHQYQKENSFVREPFVVAFQSDRTAIKKFILVPLHTEPSQAAEEIDRLYDVFEEVSNKWNNTNVMFLGDFHASCAYVTRASKKEIRLFSNSKFSTLIGDKVDTTVSDDTHCAYDRIIVHGPALLKTITPFSATVFNYRKEFKLSKRSALELSDHLPVEVRLKSSAPLLQATPLLILLSVSAIVQSFLSAL